MMALAAILCVSTFVACGGDDNNEETTDTKTSSFNYSFSFNDELLSIADVKISYIDTNGEEKSEYVSSTSWEKTFTANKFDVSAGVAISMSLKNGVELTKESYKIKFAYSYLITSTKNGKTVANNPFSISKDSAIGASDVESILKRRSGSTAFKIDADGQIEKTTLSWSDNGIKGDLELIPFL